MQRESDYDVIVIGSGLGGLTAAACLAALGRRTLVLEQHYVAGGNAHVFRRQKKFEFDVGVHYIGDCGPDGMIPAIFRAIGAEGRVEFVEMDEDGFDTLQFPGLEFRVPKGWDNYRDRLVATFPDDETAIHRYIDVLRKVVKEREKVKLPIAPEDLPRLMQEAPNFLTWSLRPLSALFDECGLGTKARAVLSGECGDYALPPSQAPIALHAVLMDSYLKGAYYPRGGGQVIPATLVEVIQANGGEVRTRNRVERILVEDGRVRGVRLATGVELRAPVVISNGDIKRTMLDMVGREHLKPETLARIQQFRMSLPLFVVYLGLDTDLRETMPRTNYCIFSSFDMEAPYVDAQEGRIPEDMSVFISAGSVKDPDSENIAPKGYSSVELMSVVPADYRLWSIEEGPVAGERYHRNASYRSFKHAIAERMIDIAEKTLPGLREHIVWREVATPITHERYTHSTGGTSYGIDLGVDQFGPLRPEPATEIEGLYLAGASTVFAHGIAGVMRGGVGTAGAIAGYDLFKLVTSGARIGNPAELPRRPDGWDAWEASRRDGPATRGVSPGQLARGLPAGAGVAASSRP